jgi:hypothetical protein
MLTTVGRGEEGLFHASVCTSPCRRQCWTPEFLLETPIRVRVMMGIKASSSIEGGLWAKSGKMNGEVHEMREHAWYIQGLQLPSRTATQSFPASVDEKTSDQKALERGTPSFPWFDRIEADLSWLTRPASSRRCLNGSTEREGLWKAIKFLRKKSF